MEKIKLILDDDNYVKSVCLIGDLDGSMEFEVESIPEDLLKYHTCFKYEDNKLILDESKKSYLEQVVEDEQELFELQEYLVQTDYKVLQRLREIELGTNLSMSNEEYHELEENRQNAVLKIRSIEESI